MRRSRQLLEDRVERWMAADTNADSGDPVADFVAILRSESTQEASSSEEMAGWLARETKSTSVPLRETSRNSRPIPAKWRRRAVISTFLSTMFGKLLVGSVALAVSAGGLTATGNLPDPAQNWVAEHLAQIGIEVPYAGEVETADRSGNVLDVIEGTDPADRDGQFGQDLADTASDGVSSEKLADPQNSSGGTGEVADDYIPAEAEVPEDPGSQGEPGQNLRP